jgi:hypothetical protein
VNAKKKFYNDQIDTAAFSSKKIFNVTNDLLGRKATKVFPKNVSSSELPTHFSNFFVEKIRAIREQLDSSPCDHPSFAHYDGCVFDSFEAVSEEEIHNLILQSPPKSCVLDPIPTSLTKLSMSELVPLVTKIINLSLESGVMPDHFKRAVVTPILKKPGLDANELKHYRPVSNLPFISKILEKVVLIQLQNHLYCNNLVEEKQSAYRKNHSCETAVLSVLEDLLVNADDRLVSLVALLDLSAAFDTLDHDILLKRLEITFGIKGVVLDWFKSYVSGRTCSVLVGSSKSPPASLEFGVPQGSVLGPILFTLYAQPLSDVIQAHQVSYHKYADDTKLSKSSDVTNFSFLQSSVQACCQDVLRWMNSNKLMLNTQKTELMPVGSTVRLGLVGSDSAKIGSSHVSFQKSVKYLGVTIDNTLSMKEHIGNVSRSCFLELRRISTIRLFLSTEICIRLVTALISSRLDYCNSIYANLPSEDIERLQRIQSAAARLVLKKRKSDHITPLLKQLHWLPVMYRWQYKLSILAFRHFDGSLPAYLSNILTIYHPARTLRSSSEKLLVVPVRNMKTVGHRSFSFSAPHIWNSLPASLRNLPSLSSFKSGLKFFFFKKAFGDM